MIDVKKLLIEYQGKRLLDISFSIESSLAMVGMSGSGKSLTLKAMLNMLPLGMRLKSEIESDFGIKRGKSAALIPQNPFTSLSPMSRIEKQFFVPREKMRELLKMVGLDEWVLGRFPTELSGGQLQRVVIAIALSHEPKLLMLDEPTTALDSTTKETIIALLKELQKKVGFYLLFVSHDIASVENLCEEIVVLKEGMVVESGNLETVMNTPQHKYTKKLIDSNFRHRRWRE